MNRFALCSIALLVTLPSAFAQGKVSRPRITGIHHVIIFVSDMTKAREFYEGILGFRGTDDPLPGGIFHCGDKSNSCYSIGKGEHAQRIELEQATSPVQKNWLAEVVFATDDVPKLHAYLGAHGLESGPIGKIASGTELFVTSDPEGHSISFISDSGATHGIDPPSSGAISSRIIHAGFVVKDRAAMDHFYKDILGFRPYWHGGFKDTDTDWVELQVPDGDDWIEYMLNIPASADKKELGVQNHFSLGVPDIHATEAKIKANGAASYDGPEVGRDGKLSLDLYDPDGTRVELMEFAPVQKPCCSEYTAPHPKP